MKKIVVAAVNSKQSINLELSQKISFVGEYDLIDLNDWQAGIPIFSNDLFQEKIPQQIISLHENFTLAKNIIIVTPEHNGYFSAFLKNILDWLSVVDRYHFTDKNLVLVVATPSTSGGKRLCELGAKSLSFTGAISVKSFLFGEYSPEKDVNNEINNLVLYIDSLT